MQNHPNYNNYQAECLEIMIKLLFTLWLNIQTTAFHNNNYMVVVIAKYSLIWMRIKILI